MRTSARASTPFSFSRNPLRCRVFCTSKGFGDEAQKSADRAKRRETKKEVQEAVKFLKERKTRPIDPTEASQGKLDVATIRNWGSGKLENLEVESFMSNRTVDPSAPLHVRLAKTLQFLENAGELDCQVYGLQPFEKWDFQPTKYAKVLNNLATVHGVYDETLKVLLDALEGESKIGDLNCEALRLLSSERGLDRGEILEQDFQNFLTGTPEVPSTDASPTPRVSEYVKYLTNLGTFALFDSKEEKRIESLCQFMTHGYVLRLTHITSNSRIVSVAVEKLDLIPKNAVCATRDYPVHIEDPLRAFVKDVNSIGRLLTEDHKQVMFDELPKAFKPAALLFEPLALAEREVKV